MSTFAEAQMIHLRAEVEALVSEREGMIALNKQREAHGKSMAYDDGAFQKNADALRCVVPDPHIYE